MTQSLRLSHFVMGAPLKQRFKDVKLSFASPARFVSLKRVIPSAAEDPKETEQEEKEEVPIWIRREQMRELQKTEMSGLFELPFFVSLPLSVVIAIAAVGSVFEFINRNPVFGIIQPESPFWLPTLAFFALTGLPVSGFFFFSAVAAANKMADQMDRIDKA